MILLYISLVITILDLVLLGLMSVNATQLFKSRYPELKIPKLHWSNRAIQLIRALLFAILPIINIGILWIFLTKNDEIREETVNKMAMECLKQQVKDLENDVRIMEVEEGIFID